MRFAVLAVAMLALGGCNGCKDKPAARKVSVDEPARPPAHPTMQAPEVSGPGVVAVGEIAARISLSRTELRLDDQAVGELSDGALDKDMLAKLLHSLAAKTKGGPPSDDLAIGIALDATLPYYRVTALLGALRNAGYKKLALLVGNGSRMVPIEMPDNKDVAGTVRPVVTVMRGRIKLWSQTGVEGTPAKPLLDTPLDQGTQPLTAALGDLVKRRWPSGERAPQDKAIFVQIGGAETAETLLRIIAAARTSGPAELFPVIFLIGGV